jgi:diguanylate cyclase (GGDEF)-like protein
MSAKECEIYGFGSPRWGDRLALLGLTPDHRALAIRLRDEAIAPNLDAIITEFYDTLLALDETRRFLESSAMVTLLQQAQRRYLLGFGVNFDSRGYCADRLRIGRAHARIGLPLSVYQCAYARLQEIILGHLPARVLADKTDLRAMTSLVLKIAALDMSLATESYHYARIEHLEDSIGELRDEASTDALTGIANRKRALAMLDEALANARRPIEPLCLMMSDLDHFKRVNDTFGHLVGDEVLRDVARRMGAALREEDLVGRYGGDEFIVIVRDTPRRLALEIAERVRNRVSSTAVSVHGLKIFITLSVGLTEAAVEDSARELLERADGALYAAKKSGRDRVVTNYPDASAQHGM